MRPSKLATVHKGLKIPNTLIVMGGRGAIANPETIRYKRHNVVMTREETQGNK